jgi:hypothetical protein
MGSSSAGGNMDRDDKGGGRGHHRGHHRH